MNIRGTQRFLLFVRRLVETFRFYTTPSKNRFLLAGFVYVVNDKLTHANFGDDLSYYLIKELTGKKIFNYHNLFFRRKHENILCIGSIINDWSNVQAIIWGSGIMYEDREIREKPKCVRAVRGPLSRELLLKQGIECPEIYGDPALLLPMIYEPKVSKIYKYGIIPHINDYDNIIVEKLAKHIGSCRIISMSEYDKWQDKIDEICECECIISSSLHGLIISDAYKIPNVWVKFSDRILGDKFKYLDYFASVGKNDMAPIRIESVDSFCLIEKAKLNYSFPVIDIKGLLRVAPFELLPHYRYE